MPAADWRKIPRTPRNWNAGVLPTRLSAFGRVLSVGNNMFSGK
jgi:hypothetical protein